MESFEGTLEGGDLLALLRSIHATRAVGLLSVQGDPDLVSVTFREGGIVAADAMNRPAEEALSSLLASRGLLSPAEFQKAIEPYLGTGRPPGEVLLEQNLVGRRELLEAVRDQTYSQVLRLLRWDTGNLSWNAGVESPYQEGMEVIGVPELLVRSVADLGVESPLRQPLPSLDSRFHASGDGGRTIRVVGREGDGLREQDPNVVWLTPDEERIWSALSERRRASDLAEATGLSRFEVVYALHQLETSSLVEADSFGVPTDDLAELTRDVGLDGSSALEAPATGSLSSPAVFEPLPTGDLGGGEARGVAEDSRSGAVTSWDDATVTGTGELLALDSHDLEEDFEEEEVKRPEPVESPSVPMRPLSRAAVMTTTATWVVRGIALGMVLLVVGLIALGGDRSAWFLPFPWLEAHRQSFERTQSLALYGEIDRAVRTYYLLYNRYPEELGILVDLELLSRNDLHDQRNRWMDFSSSSGGYVLQPMEGGRGVPGAELTAEVQTDFLLNPKFIEPPSTSSRALVLLD